MIRLLLSSLILFSISMAQAGPMSQYMNQEGGMVDAFRGRTNGELEKNPELFNSIAAISCVGGVVTLSSIGALMIKPNSVEGRDWYGMSKKDYDKILKKNPHLRKLDVAQNIVTKFIFGAFGTFTASICIRHYGPQLLDKIIANPRAAYNEDEAFRTLVEEQGWSDAIDFAKAVRRRGPQVDIDLGKPHARKVVAPTPGEGEFFDDDEAGANR